MTLAVLCAGATALPTTTALGSPSPPGPHGDAEAAAGAARRATQAQDTVDVQHVLDAFHEAVVSHDGARLAALFLPDASTWLKVLSDGAYARITATAPNTPRVAVGSYQDFARFVSSSKVSLDPRHSNVRIHTDRTIAAVYFDFVFLIDGKEQNRGSETWQLVKGSSGWRIAAITYSSDPQTP